MKQFVFYFLLLFLPTLVVADEAPEDDVKNCHRYRAKKERIPVYEQPDTTSAVVGHLRLGEHVCYVGEQQGYATVDWGVQHVFSSERKKSSRKSRLVFVRLVDLWEPVAGLGSKQKKGPEGFIAWMKSYYHYLRSGGVPEDGLIPYRPVIDLVQ